MDGIVDLLRLLADDTRLRVVRLLLRDALNVGELQRILGLAQPTVSKQLGELKRAGLVRERRDGNFSFHELVRPTEHPSFAAIAAEVEASPDAAGDLARLAEVLSQREDRGEGEGRFLEPGRSWAAWARALRFLLPPLKVADFGCGDGALTVEMAAWARSVVAIDRNPLLLARAAERVSAAGLRNVSFVKGDLETIDLRAASVELVVISQALHHVKEPSAVAAQAHRVVAKRGRVLVLELAPHHETWVKEKLGHIWLGFEPAYLKKTLDEAGFDHVEVDLIPGRAAQEPFRVLIATGVKA